MTSILFSSTILSYLPQHEGYLPKWLFLIAIVSIGNSIQSYSTIEFTSRVYCGHVPLPQDRLPGSTTTSPPKSKTSKATPSIPSTSPATPLQSRTFGTWTVLASLVRLYAAYYISNPQVYDLAIATFAVAGFHFVSEWLVFRSTSWGKGLIGPLCVASLSLGWMVWGKEGYVGGL